MNEELQSYWDAKAPTMYLRSMSNLVLSLRSIRTRCFAYGHRNVTSLNDDAEGRLDEELISSEWYRAAYAKLIRISHVLEQVHYIDGRVTNIKDNSVIFYAYVISQMQAYNALARAFIGLPSMQHVLQKNSGSSMTLDSLTKVCNFLNISAQQRKTIRLTICPQVTQHHIWRGALEQILINLKSDIDSFNCHSQTLRMAKQITSSCIEFLADATELSDSETPSWMRPAPIKKVEKPVPRRKWEEVLEMFVDLSQCLSQEERLKQHFTKLEVMREGLYQIKDILVERDISYKEARRQDCLVQRKLTKSLGHSSKCLFTLLLYYLYGSVRDIEVEVCECVHVNGDKFSLNVGKILTCCDEEMLWSGVKQLSRALGVYKFVWETAGMKGKLELQGHLWCLGAEERSFVYRGVLFFIHCIRL
ncbi:hypothetical protein J5N97_013273 [Dioscorea zingiberensis]|uniref:Uncharacterized protein n=1 Tax=Dioscorea zingiberensis TaxID=325984 RepID=A0A9D5CRJ5_9LILI|nr:hypothetical protein J5N97_013273 [Dioscorea zingiberensis]